MWIYSQWSTSHRTPQDVARILRVNRQWNSRTFVTSFCLVVACSADAIALLAVSQACEKACLWNFSPRCHMTWNLHNDTPPNSPWPSWSLNWKINATKMATGIKQAKLQQANVLKDKPAPSGQPSTASASCSKCALLSPKQFIFTSAHRALCNEQGCDSYDKSVTQNELPK